MALTKTNNRMIDGAEVNILDFGAVGDGVADDSAAIQAAIDYVKTNCVYNNGANTTPRGGQALYFPAGIYRISSTISVQNVNGVSFRGDGSESTVLMWTGGAGSMLDVGQHIQNSWSDMMWASASGPVTLNANNKPNMPIYAEGAYAGTAFNWDGTGGDRFNTFTNVKVIGGFDKIFHVQGAITHDATTLKSCKFFRSNYVWYSNNAQSMITQFFGCDAEFIAESVFYYIAGGYLSVYGGSFINPKDTLTLAGTSAQIGTSNGGFSFYDVKWEMFQNIDPSTNPYLIRQTSNAVAQIYMVGCSNDAGLPDAGADMMVLAGGTNLVIESSTMVGVIDTTPAGGERPYVKLLNNRKAPTVTRNVNSGSTYRVFNENSGLGGAAAHLDKFDFRAVNKTLDYPARTIYHKAEFSISTATNTDFTVSVPDQFIVSDALFTIARAGGVAITVELYMDAARTIPVFSQATGSSVTHNIWKPTLTAYAPVSVASYLSGTSLYGRIVTGGNAGLVTVRLYLNGVQYN